MPADNRKLLTITVKLSTYSTVDALRQAQKVADNLGELLPESAQLKGVSIK